MTCGSTSEVPFEDLLVEEKINVLKKEIEIMKDRWRCLESVNWSLL